MGSLRGIKSLFRKGLTLPLIKVKGYRDGVTLRNSGSLKVHRFFRVNTRDKVLR